MLFKLSLSPCTPSLLVVCLIFCTNVCQGQAFFPCTVTLTNPKPLGGCIFYIEGVPSDAACGTLERGFAGATGFSGTLYDYDAVAKKACAILVSLTKSTTPPRCKP